MAIPDGLVKRKSLSMCQSTTPELTRHCFTGDSYCFRYSLKCRNSYEAIICSLIVRRTSEILIEKVVDSVPHNVTNFAAGAADISRFVL